MEVKADWSCPPAYPCDRLTQTAQTLREAQNELRQWREMWPKDVVENYEELRAEVARLRESAKGLQYEVQRWRDAFPGKYPHEAAAKVARLRSILAGTDARCQELEAEVTRLRGHFDAQAELIARLRGIIASHAKAALAKGGGDE